MQYRRLRMALRRRSLWHQYSGQADTDQKDPDYCSPRLSRSQIEVMIGDPAGKTEHKRGQSGDSGHSCARMSEQKDTSNSRENPDHEPDCGTGDAKRETLRRTKLFCETEVSPSVHMATNVKHDLIERFQPDQTGARVFHVGDDIDHDDRDHGKT